jgi:methylmalonyl-CoA mutase N-terminal domain/subunit
MPRHFDRPEDVARAIEPGDEEPGVFPFTRGIQPAMYRDRLWTMRQYAGYGTPADSNARFRYLLRTGVTGLSVAFDLPTQMGFDSDHVMAAGEVGRVGVAIDSIEDMTALFDGIPLDRISCSMTINATAAILLAFYVSVAKRRGLPLASLSGTIQNDVLKEYIARGTQIYPPQHSLRLTTDILAWCDRELPRWNPISISGYHIREAGATAVQEVAFTLADAIAYVEAARAAGLDLDRIGERLSFFFAAHNNFIEEIAKFRAARRLWAHIMRDRFGVTRPRAMQLRFHAQTAGSTLTATQPNNNIVRVAVQAMAAVLGGAQSLHCNSRDEALALPTEASALLALRTQQIIASETGVTNTVDPAGGAWTVERETDRIVAGAAALIADIDASGGTLAAIQRGWIQRQIHEAAYAAQQALDAGTFITVGVNRYADEGSTGTDEHLPNVDILRIDPQMEARQADAVKTLRAARPAGPWREAVDAVERTAATSDNLMPPILAAVEAQATIGEISDALRRVFGVHHEPAW